MAGVVEENVEVAGRLSEGAEEQGDLAAMVDGVEGGRTRGVVGASGIRSRCRAPGHVVVRIDRRRMARQLKKNEAAMNDAANVKPLISDRELDLLFREARSFNDFTSQPVTDAELRALFDIAKWGPVIRAAGIKVNE